MLHLLPQKLQTSPIAPGSAKLPRKPTATCRGYRPGLAFGSINLAFGRLAPGAQFRIRDLVIRQGDTVAEPSRLGEEERHAIGDLVRALTEQQAELSFETDEQLIAGVRVEFSSQAIDSTLADVLDAVRERIDALAPEPEEEEGPAS